MSNETFARVLDGADPAVRMQNDLFHAMSGTWTRNKEIPADLTSYGSLVKLRFGSRASVWAIIEDFASGEQEGDAKKIPNLFSSWMDTDTLNQLSMAPLGKDLELVEVVSSHGELAEIVGSLVATGVASFFSVGVSIDINDPSRYVTFLEQSDLGLLDEACYHEKQHAETLAKYTDLVPSLLEFSGICPAASVAPGAAAVLRLETEFAPAHMALVERRNPEKYNNPLAWPDFVESTPGFVWEKALRAADAPMETIDSLLVSTLRTLTTSAAIWARTGLADLKAYTHWRILHMRATFLTKEINRANLDFHDRVLAGPAGQRERWRRGVVVVEDVFDKTLGRECVIRHFPSERKGEIPQLVGDLPEIYYRSISALDQMDEETKARILAKVDAFSLKIGYPSEWRGYSELEVDEGLVDNIHAANRWENARDLIKLGKLMDCSEWPMFPQTVNAHYYPVWNEIVFPVAILQFPFFDPKRDAASSYGAIGMIIGHEIGHEFDG